MLTNNFPFQVGQVNPPGENHFGSDFNILFKTPNTKPELGFSMPSPAQNTAEEGGSSSSSTQYVGDEGIHNQSGGSGRQSLEKVGFGENILGSVISSGENFRTHIMCLM